jgi:hypothetical protein
MQTKKIYEFSAIFTFNLCVAADSEKEAREEAERLETSWWMKGDFIEKNDVELIEVRKVKSEDLNDEAHVIV